MINECGDITIEDPVCGEVVEMAEVAASELYEGWAYYFCSRRCRERFTRAPARYARRPRLSAARKG